jgi:glycosyltransferase involved in cell wall biosynthesis
MLASVIINNFNYGRYLKQAIDSALSQTYKMVEVVVVDDGSTDNSRAVMAEYGGSIKSVFKPNGGQSSALNAGFAASTGGIICLLDSDDWFFRNKIEAVAGHFASHRDIQWVFDPVEMSLPDGSTRKAPLYPKDVYVDMRDSAPRGKFGPTAPPTSGLSFGRELLGRVLPMSEDIRIGSDNYLKFVGTSLAPGVQLEQPLTAQRIHGANAGTLRQDKLLSKAQFNLLAARDLRLKFPSLARMGDKLFAMAAADYLRCRQRDAVCEATISSYLKQCSGRDVAEIALRTVYKVFQRMGSSG